MKKLQYLDNTVYRQNVRTKHWKQRAGSHLYGHAMENALKCFASNYVFLIGEASPIRPSPIQSILSIRSPELSPPYTSGYCTERHSCKPNWVFPALLSPASSVMPLNGTPPRSRASRTGQAKLSLCPGSKEGHSPRCTCNAV
jgi:hypothetical protein